MCLESPVREGTALALTALLGFLLASVPVQGQASQVSIEIIDGGVARVRYTVYTEGVTELSIPLVGVPDPSFLLTVTDELNEPLAYELNETLGTINVACIDASEVRISYYTQTLTYKIGKTWYVNFSSPYMVNIILPPNATVTYLNKVPEEIVPVKGSISLLFEPGEVVVGYVFAYTPLPQPPSEPQQGGVSKPPEETGKGADELKALLESIAHYAIVIIAILALALTVAVAIHRRRAKRALEKLSEEDVQIIEGLKRLGGGAFQRELQRVVNLPTTTLWRRLKRLEDVGLIVIEKRAGRNYIRLARAASVP